MIRICIEIVNEPPQLSHSIPDNSSTHTHSPVCNGARWRSPLLSKECWFFGYVNIWTIDKVDGLFEFNILLVLKGVVFCLIFSYLGL